MSQYTRGHQVRSWRAGVPAEFSSNPNQTHLKQLIKVLLGILETSRQVCWGKLELNSAGHRPSRIKFDDPCSTLKENGLLPFMLPSFFWLLLRLFIQIIQICIFNIVMGEKFEKNMLKNYNNSTGSNGIIRFRQEMTKSPHSRKSSQFVIIMTVKMNSSVCSISD